MAYISNEEFGQMHDRYLDWQSGAREEEEPEEDADAGEET